jgi:hypothetical protein
MTVLLWVLIAAAFLLIASLCLLSYALFQVVRGPIRVIDVTPDEPTGIAPAETFERAGLEGEPGIRRMRPGGWPHS